VARKHGKVFAGSLVEGPSAEQASALGKSENEE
jgi:hypothetical protein